MKEFQYKIEYRGYGESPIEHLYHLFFPDQGFPSVISMGDLKKEVLEEFKEPRFKRLAIVKTVSDDKEYDYDEDSLTPTEVGSSGPKDETTSMYQDTESTVSCILKVSPDEDDTVHLAAACTDVKYLEELYAHFKKKYIESKDYKKDTFFGILYNDGRNIKVKKYPLNDKVVIDTNLEYNYGKDFLDKHTKIIGSLINGQRGLYVFNGKPGTGKTTYIKLLAKELGKDRTFIFIPTTCLDALVSPNLLPVLLKNKNSVIVLEDAEKAVVSREQQQGNESLVSTLLNLGDGILGSMLNISIIVTFNTDREKVDAALLRKGRLLYEYEFGALSIDDSQRLIDKLGKKHTATEAMTLAEIYNLEVDTNHAEKPERKIGFNQ